MGGGNKAAPRHLVLTGPTGVGKTGLGLTLSKVFGAEIVSVDSMQVYRYMDIGTAKPTPAEQAEAPHHLIDVVDPDQSFDAAAYLGLARPVISRLHRQRVPIVAAGGTGLYLRSLLKGLFPGPKKNPEIRARLKAEAREYGTAAVHGRLAEIDPKAAERIHVNDLVRIVRALEVYELTGRPISVFQDDHRLGESPYGVMFFCLNLPRDVLYARIAARTREMFDQGWVEEVEGLLARGFSGELKSMQAIGYRQIVRHLAGRLTREEAIDEIIKQTRRLAKRQLTWFRAQPEAIWISPRDVERVREAAARFWEGQ